MSRTPLIVISVVGHLALGVGLGHLQPTKSHAATAIEIANVPKKKPDVKPPEPAKVDPDPPKKSAPREARKVAAPAPPAENTPPPPAADAHAVADALPDFGLSLSGGVGGDGLAIPHGGPGGSDAPRAKSAAPVKKLLAAAPTLPSDECQEALVKPKPLAAMPQPAYSSAARAAAIEGKVKVKISVDESGKIIDVTVLAGLGYGLDESAVAAARTITFDPATLCGKKVRASFVIGFRFSPPSQ